MCNINSVYEIEVLSFFSFFNLAFLCTGHAGIDDNINSFSTSKLKLFNFILRSNEICVDFQDASYECRISNGFPTTFTSRNFI